MQEKNGRYIALHHQGCCIAVHHQGCYIALHYRGCYIALHHQGCKLNSTLHHSADVLLQVQGNANRLADKPHVQVAGQRALRHTSPPPPPRQTDHRERAQQGRRSPHISNALTSLPQARLQHSSSAEVHIRRTDMTSLPPNAGCTRMNTCPFSTRSPASTAHMPSRAAHGAFPSCAGRALPAPTNPSCAAAHPNRMSYTQQRQTSSQNEPMRADSTNPPQNSTNPPQNNSAQREPSRTPLLASGQYGPSAVNHFGTRGSSTNSTNGVSQNPGPYRQKQTTINGGSSANVHNFSHAASIRANMVAANNQSRTNIQHGLGGAGSRDNLNSGWSSSSSQGSSSSGIATIATA